MALDPCLILSIIILFKAVFISEHTKTLIYTCSKFSLDWNENVGRNTLLHQLNRIMNTAAIYYTSGLYTVIIAALSKILFVGCNKVISLNVILEVDSIMWEEYFVVWCLIYWLKLSCKHIFATKQKVHNIFVIKLTGQVNKILNNIMWEA